MENVIEVSDVCKSFKGVKVLNNINMNVEKGIICGLIGRNGSGKTLLMKTICGFLSPDSGSIIVNGKYIGKDIDFPDNVGIIIETPGFMPYMSGFNNLKNLASIKGYIDDKTIRDNMVLVGLDPNEKKWVHKYSLGMRQRLGIAQSIMEEQELVILDEPMNSLDKEGVTEVRNILIKLKETGKTILIASHNQMDIEILCDKVYEIEKGQIEEVHL